MLVIKVKKVPSTFNKILVPYMYKIDSGLYVGDVTRKIYEELLELIPIHIGCGSAIIVWKNGMSDIGFDLTGVGNTNLIDIDGINFIH